MNVDRSPYYSDVLEDESYVRATANVEVKAPRRVRRELRDLLVGIGILEKDDATLGFAEWRMRIVSNPDDPADTVDP